MSLHRLHCFSLLPEGIETASGVSLTLASDYTVDGVVESSGGHWMGLVWFASGDGTKDWLHTWVSSRELLEMIQDQRDLTGY